MKKIIILMFIFGGVVFTIMRVIEKFNSRDPFEENPKCPNAVFNLTYKQIAQNIQKAFRGDANAAHKLRMHYEMMTTNKYKRNAWCYIDSKTGSGHPKHTRAFQYLCDEKIIDKERFFILTNKEEKDFLEKDDLFHLYCLYMHYRQSGDYNKANSLLERLKEKNLTPLLSDE